MITFHIQLFKLLLAKDTEKSIVQNSIKYFDKRIEKEKLKNLIDSIPNVYGVFYIHDSKGKVIYIAKGKNIKIEISKLFLRSTKRALKIQTKAQSISFDTFGTEILVRLKYYHELDKLSPKYNFKKKFKSKN